ncbi:MAG TPA: M3 family oligoendopeptidase [Thermoleophilaceae bacterium]|nr:M3 family oligoendopeptidase [Thermoleophilaceae bacterium]
MSTATDSALESAAWDLEPLVDGRGADGVAQLLADARERAAAFAERHRGKLGELDAGALAEAMRKLAEIHDLAGRAGSYAMLDFTLDTTDPARGALVQKAREMSAAIETELLFFELEWNQLPDEHADRLLESDPLAFCSHYLRTLRRYRPHQLSEPEERVVTELDVTGSSAFRRLFTEQISALDVALPGTDEPTSLEEALSRLQHPDRSTREAAAGAVTEALRPGLRTRAYVLNTLLADKSTKDRLRDYPHWLASRNLANEASDESVEALIQAVAGRYELARRWYRLKARLLGLDRLAHWDRMAPLSDTDERIAYDEAREIVLDCYTGFSPELGAAAGAFFENGYIDGPPRPGKRGGAFCSYTVPSRHPYVMLNYTSRPHDVLVLAHELGHGVHASLARPQGIFQFTTPLTMAETASIFGETIVLERLLERAPDAAERLSLLAGSLDGVVAAVFRQVAMNRFEHGIHTARREDGELPVERFAELWLGTQADLLGDAVELNDDYGLWWSYVPHFVDVPGYVYAYAYGNLLALSVYRRYEEEGAGFVDAYLELLRAGGSRPPEELGRIVGVDLTDPGFWSSGLDLIERQLEAAERAAEEAGRSRDGDGARAASEEAGRTA